MPGHTTESLGTLSTDTRDALLVKQAQEGDADAFGQLVRRHERSVYAIASRMTASQDEAEDVTQEVFVQAWKSICRFRGDSQFSTWLHTIAVNATLKRLHYLRRRRTLSTDDPNLGLAEKISGDSLNEPLDKAFSAHTKEAVRRALSRLSDNHRMAVTLHYFEDYNCDEIARMMRCSVGTVWSRLHYACRKLKVELASAEAAGVEQTK